jgi:nucleotide-binding universal stress UspA family protein
MHRLLVPLDGSPLAELALPWAQHLACITGADLSLVQVVEPPAAVEYLVYTESVTQMLHEQAEDYLAAVAARLRAQQLRVQTRAVIGDPAAEIILAGHAADLIVMATHGRSGLGRWVSGSVADRVLRGASVPVLLAPAGADKAGSAQLRRILVPLDGSELAEHALPLASRLARPAGAELILLRSTEWDPIVGGMYVSAQTVAELTRRYDGEARAYLEAVSHRQALAGIPIHCAVRSDPAADSIVAGAAATAADLIVMTTHGRGGVGRWVYGSVADRVLRRSSVPIVLVRASVPVRPVV